MNSLLRYRHERLIFGTPFKWCLQILDPLEVNLKLLKQMVRRWVPHHQPFRVTQQLLPFNVLDVVMTLRLGVGGLEVPLNESVVGKVGEPFSNSKTMKLKDLIKMFNVLVRNDDLDVYVLYRLGRKGFKVAAVKKKHLKKVMKVAKHYVSEIMSQLLTATDYSSLGPRQCVDNMALILAATMFMYFEKRLPGVIKRMIFSPMFGTHVLYDYRKRPTNKHVWQLLDYQPYFRYDLVKVEELLFADWVFIPIVSDGHWWYYALKLCTMQLFVIDSLAKGIRGRARIDRSIHYSHALEEELPIEGLDLIWWILLKDLDLWWFQGISESKEIGSYDCIQVAGCNRLPVQKQEFVMKLQHCSHAFGRRAPQILSLKVDFYDQAIMAEGCNRLPVQKQESVLKLQLYSHAFGRRGPQILSLKVDFYDQAVVSTGYNRLPVQKQEFVLKLQCCSHDLGRKATQILSLKVDFYDQAVVVLMIASKWCAEEESDRHLCACDYRQTIIANQCKNRNIY
ncbi:hypothetical protein V8G54_007501 [Vigna mungo]|uniref:Ubiquitin-like protease family profile domain-containing protein n=1 Tax=Vigna mungo TaxID=3915 RepID=A0AAQ3S956_VIGMU